MHIHTCTYTHADATEYGVRYPLEEFSTDEAARGVRLSAVHAATAARGAVYGAVGSHGWERPLHFAMGAPAAAPPQESSGAFFTPEAHSYDRRQASWWEPVAREHHAARQGVALFDLSAFGKLRVSGPDAADALEWLSSAPLAAAADGKLVYTQLLNARGGIESDLTVVPLGAALDAAGPGGGGAGGPAAERAFYLVTGSGTCTRDADHIVREAAAAGLGRVRCEEQSDAWAVLALMGPESRRLLARVAPHADLSNDAFPFGTAQPLPVTIGAPVVARALRVSYVGELGWELHVPAAHALPVMEALHAAARDGGAAFNDGRGLVDGGARALLHSLRLEKRFVHFGHDVSPVDSPIDSGLGFVSAAKLRSGTPFLGRDAIVAAKAAPRRRLLSFSVDDDDVSLWGREGIYRDGARVGHITSAGFGHSVAEGRAIGIGYAGLGPEPPPIAGVAALKEHLLSGSYELEVAGRRVPARAHWDAMYDPTASRMRDVEGTAPAS